MSLATLPERPKTERPKTLQPSKTLEDCDAVMILLASGKIVVIHHDGPIRLWSADCLCKPIRRIRPDEHVYYNGKREVVRAISVY
ncbi:hypothetical protein [Rhodopirellula sp. MGV]|uniref:hypothetical protein n=1 Tax=Rhodopirellula sp. MGV TaxID=2023130 RepID=UPI000B97C769|nr:hypothetical protein [Rhodopirellula sp. MGV]PNY37935.1 hypothetical protein C2E31_05395 [Rhodopirellula baltica]